MTPATQPITINPYETDELLNQYLAFHYGETYFGVGNYPAVCAQICVSHLKNRPRRRALDLGCAVGRTAFELAREFEDVTGIDLSSRFVQAADELKAGRHLEVRLIDEGQLGRDQSVCLSDCGLQTIAGKVTFEVGDACALAPHHRNFDLIFAGNLIDRVEDPKAFLEGLTHRITPGGLLVISSPYTLLTDYTPIHKWIGGRVIDGKPVTMLQGMQALLAGEFRLQEEPLDVPFVIRETARKFQHSVAQLTIWERI